MHTSWVVVADAARARIFTARGASGELEEIADLVHPDSRRPAHVAGTDAPGRSYDRFGGARHAIVGHEDKKSGDVRTFAREIADRLARGRRAGEFDRIYLLAEPRLLGAIRPALDHPTRACVAAESACDLVPQSVHAIRHHLPDYL